MSTATTAAEASAGLTLTVTGSLMGLQFDVMMLGFFGALVAQTFVNDPPIESLTPLRRYVRVFAQLLAAGLLAGLLTPVAESILAGMLPGHVGAPALHLATAGAIGMVAPVVVPLLRKLLNKLAEKP
jgi:hypothetical protein